MIHLSKENEYDLAWKLYTFFGLMISVLITCGCSQQVKAPSACSEHSANCGAIEYIRNSPGKFCRITLVAGVARVEVKANSQRYAVLLPAKPDEIRRLFQILELAGSKPEIFNKHARNTSSQIQEAPIDSIRWWVAGASKQIPFNSDAREGNLVLNGMCREIEAIAMADLACAIVHHEIADQEFANNAHEQASNDYQWSINLLLDWGRSQAGRVGGGIYEPEVEQFHATIGGKEMVVSGIPRDVMAMNGMGREVGIDLLQRAWRTYTSEFDVKSSQGVIVVDYNEDYPTLGLEKESLSADIIRSLRR